jgi:hypothetical protein
MGDTIYRRKPSQVKEQALRPTANGDESAANASRHRRCGGDAVSLAAGPVRPSAASKLTRRFGMAWGFAGVQMILG